MSGSKKLQIAENMNLTENMNVTDDRSHLVAMAQQ
jgi:hypothetical protein